MTMEKKLHNPEVLELSVQELAEVSGGVYQPGGPLEELKNSAYTARDEATKLVDNIEIPGFVTIQTSSAAE